MNITRSAYLLTDLFGDMGGILQIITLVMALLLAGYSEQSFILSAFRKLNKQKYIDFADRVLPDNLIPKMGSVAQIWFQLTRFFKCCGGSNKVICDLYDKTSKEIEE